MSSTAPQSSSVPPASAPAFVGTPSPAATGRTPRVSSKAVSTTVQVILALVLLIILYVITLLVLNMDSIVMSRSIVVKPREVSPIFDGWVSSSVAANMSYNTINPFVANFRKIGKSINTQGGAQFTYQFWLRLDDVAAENFANRVILLKGDLNKYKVGYYDMTSKKLISNKIISDYMIKCPLIKFGKTYSEIIVQFNTNKSIVYETRIDMNVTGEVGTRRNALSLMPLNWFLFTFVFEDNMSTYDNTENGIKFTMYVNDFPYHSVTASADGRLRNNFLRQNEGGLHVMPSTQQTGDFMKIANLRYYNYALTQEEAASEYAKGAPNYSAVLMSKNVAKPAYLSAYNKMDIYNY